MPMWRCPHCGTPQAETARCWVCRRSSTACGTCRHFRASVAGSIGYCGLDARRAPLSGDEIRSCWEARSTVAEPIPVDAVTPRVVAPAGPRPIFDDRANHREFVEVGDRGDEPHRLRRGSQKTMPAPRPPADDVPPEPTPPVVTPPRPAEPRWDLWGDLDR